MEHPVSLTFNLAKLFYNAGDGKLHQRDSTTFSIDYPCPSNRVTPPTSKHQHQRRKRQPTATTARHYNSRRNTKASIGTMSICAFTNSSGTRQRYGEKKQEGFRVYTAPNIDTNLRSTYLFQPRCCFHSSVHVPPPVRALHAEMRGFITTRLWPGMTRVTTRTSCNRSASLVDRQTDM